MVFDRNGMFAMVTRTQALKRFKLPIRKTFDIRSEKDDIRYLEDSVYKQRQPPCTYASKRSGAPCRGRLRAADSVLAGKIDDCAQAATALLQ